MVSAAMGMPQPAGTLVIGVCFLFLFDWKRLWVAFVCTAPWTLLLIGASDDTGSVDLATRLDRFLLSPTEHQIPIDTTREVPKQEIPSPSAASPNLTTESNPEQESSSVEPGWGRIESSKEKERMEDLRLWESINIGG
jgi:hypothetical protein